MRDVVLRSKQSTMENWSTSAAAGKPGAAKIASSFLSHHSSPLMFLLKKG
jgi:hypothetical protein